MATGEGSAQAKSRRLSRVGIALGVGLFLLLLVVPAPDAVPPAAWATLGVLCWMAVWWVTEAVPLAVTALLPLVLFPSLGILDLNATTVPYSNSVIFLFLGGFLLAKAIERCGLHRRIAHAILGVVGSGRAQLVGG